MLFLKKIFYIIKKAKETILYFSKGTIKVLWFHFVLTKYWYKMMQYNIFYVKLSNSQQNKLKSGVKNWAKVTLILSSNFLGTSNNETNFPHKLLLTNTKVSKGL